jgi:hypothetical protein
MFSNDPNEIQNMCDLHEGDAERKEAKWAAHGVSFHMTGTYFNVKIFVNGKQQKPSSTTPA